MTAPGSCSAFARYSAARAFSFSSTLGARAFRSAASCGPTLSGLTSGTPFDASSSPRIRISTSAGVKSSGARPRQSDKPSAYTAWSASGGAAVAVAGGAGLGSAAGRSCATAMVADASDEREQRPWSASASLPLWSLRRLRLWRRSGRRRLDHAEELHVEDQRGAARDRRPAAVPRRGSRIPVSDLGWTDEAEPCRRPSSAAAPRSSRESRGSGGTGRAPHVHRSCRTRLRSRACLGSEP